MIISASRRTDIPAFYGEWFVKRLQEGFVCVRNPMRRTNVSKIYLHEQVDFIVFWTKNVTPFLPYHSALGGYRNLFQYTINGYDNSIERGLPPKEEIIRSAQLLARMIGPDKLLWRYDPIFLADSFTYKEHIDRFHQLAEALQGSTETCTISLLDTYQKTKQNMAGIPNSANMNDEMQELLAELARVAKQYGIQMRSCAEPYDLSEIGIAHGKCIDYAYINQVFHTQLALPKDTNQRPTCGCSASIDIGAYHTCKHGCVYCYANANSARVADQCSLNDVDSPFLIGHAEVTDRIFEKNLL